MLIVSPMIRRVPPGRVPGIEPERDQVAEQGEVARLEQRLAALAERLARSDAGGAALG